MLNLALLESAFEYAEQFVAARVGHRPASASLRSLRFGRPVAAGETCQIRVEMVPDQGAEVTVQVYVLAEDGAALLFCEDYSLSSSDAAAVNGHKNGEASHAEGTNGRSVEPAKATSAAASRHTPTHSGNGRAAVLARREVQFAVFGAAEIRKERGELRVGLSWNGAVQPFLRQYRLMGRPALATSIFAELCAVAASVLRGDQVATGLADVVLTPVSIGERSGNLDATLIARDCKDGVECRLTSAATGAVSSATVRFGRFEAPFETSLRSEPPFGWTQFYYPEVWPVVYHGLPYRGLQHFAYQHGGGWAKIVAPDVELLAEPGSKSPWLTPTGLLESCIVACNSFQYYMLDRGFAIVPERIDALEWRRAAQPKEECVLRFQYRTNEDCFDFSLLGADKSIILTARGLRCGAWQPAAAGTRS